MKSFKIECQGYSVAADWYDGTGDEVLLFLIGYTSNKQRQEELVSALVEQTGSSALVFDYSGHGDSPFDLPEIRIAQNFLEVVTVFDWLKENHPDKEITVMGSSYGGFLATQLTKYRKFENLVLRCPAIYRPEDFYTKWKNIDRDNLRDVYRKDRAALASHPLLSRASKNFQGKTLVVVHGKDEMVPIETTDTYIEAFDAEIYVAEDFTHAMSDPTNPREKFAEYQTAIADWIKRN